jgi:HrpA-like RNA helicase
MKLLDILLSFRGSQEASCSNEILEPGHLPVDAHADMITTHIREHRCTIIQGETGSGQFAFVLLTLIPCG